MKAAYAAISGGLRSEKIAKRASCFLSSSTSAWLI
jgi:hypothetical protein